MKLDDNATIYQVFREMLGWHRCRLNKVLNKYGLYTGQPMILHALERMPNSTQKELADALREINALPKVRITVDADCLHYYTFADMNTYLRG